VGTFGRFDGADEARMLEVGNIDDGCSVGPFHVTNEGLFSLHHNLAAAGNIQVTDESAIFCFHSFLVVRS
jgi:hypothetical protein